MTLPSTYGGDIRRSEDVAHDAAFGSIGAPLLIAGFVFQSLPYFGISGSCSTTVRLIVGAATLVGASVIAWIAYGVIYHFVVESEKRYKVASMQGDMWRPPASRMSRLRFWR